MAFVISPTRGMINASADQYLGIFNEIKSLCRLIMPKRDLICIFVIIISLCRVGLCLLFCFQ